MSQDPDWKYPKPFQIRYQYPTRCSIAFQSAKRIRIRKESDQDSIKNIRQVSIYNIRIGIRIWKEYSRIVNYSSLPIPAHTGSPTAMLLELSLKYSLRGQIIVIQLAEFKCKLQTVYSMNKQAAWLKLHVLQRKHLCALLYGNS